MYIEMYIHRHTHDIYVYMYVHVCTHVAAMYMYYTCILPLRCGLVSQAYLPRPEERGHPPSLGKVYAWLVKPTLGVIRLNWVPTVPNYTQVSFTR